MIWESSDWKEPLLKTANYLRRVRFSDNTSEKTLVRIEKEVLIGFYSVRKLLDTFKVSDSTKALKFKVTYFKNIKKITYHNWHHIDELYDLSKADYEVRKIRNICDLFIHSYIYMPSGDFKITGFYVTSDLTKDKKCYFISIDILLSIFRTVGRDYPSCFEQKFNQKTNEIVSKVW
jgi:hypothetical protein